MRHLTSLLHLIFTAWAAYIAPVLLLGGLAGYFPGYSGAAYTATYVVIALGAAFLGGTILGRTHAWRNRVVQLAGVVWVVALIVSVPKLIEGRAEIISSDGFVAPFVLDLASVLLAVGLTLGLFVGARFMRRYRHTSTPPDNSLEGARNR
jgi:hypothetical protein